MSLSCSDLELIPSFSLTSSVDPLSEMERKSKAIEAYSIAIHPQKDLIFVAGYSRVDSTEGSDESSHSFCSTTDGESLFFKEFFTPSGVYYKPLDEACVPSIAVSLN